MYTWMLEEDVASPRTGVMTVVKPPCRCRVQNPVLCRNSQCSQPLAHLLLFSLFFKLLFLFCVRVVCSVVCVWRLEDSLQGLLLYFHHVEGPGDQMDPPPPPGLWDEGLGLSAFQPASQIYSEHALNTHGPGAHQTSMWLGLASNLLSCHCFPSPGITCSVFPGLWESKPQM